MGQLALVMLVAPLLQGVIKAIKARCQHRRGPGLLQPWYDILKLLKRESVVSVHVSWIYHATPYVYVGAYLAALDNLAERRFLGVEKGRLFGDLQGLRRLSDFQLRVDADSRLDLDSDLRPNETLEARLPEMFVRRQRRREHSFLHNDERDAVGHAPLLIGTAAVELRRTQVKFFGERDDFDGGIVFKRLQQFHRRPAIP